MNIHGNEFHLGRNAIILLVVIQLTALLFGIMTTTAFNSVNCVAGSSTNPSCKLGLQLSTINSTVTSLTSSFNCVFNNFNTPTCWAHAPNPDSFRTFCIINGCPLNTVAAVLIIALNVILGAVTFFVYLLALFFELILVVVFVLITFLPSLFLSSSFGAFGALFGIIFGGATTIMVIYFAYIIKNLILGKHR